MASVSDPRPITGRHLEILRWIDSQPHDRSHRDWNDDLILEGPKGNIRITVAENDRLMGMVEPNPDRAGWRQKHFALSAAGRQALSGEQREMVSGFLAAYAGSEKPAITSVAWDHGYRAGRGDITGNIDDDMRIIAKRQIAISRGEPDPYPPQP